MNLPFTIGISPTLKIRGILASRNIKKDEIIEKCPIILIPLNNLKYISETILKNYYFEWNKDFFCLALGYGSLINHSYEPNVRYILNYKTRELIFKAINAIKEGEELTVNYNWDPNDKTQLESVSLDYDKSAYTLKR